MWIAHLARREKVGDPIYPSIDCTLEGFGFAIAIFTVRWTKSPFSALQINFCNRSFSASEPFAFEQFVQHFFLCHGSMSALIAETNNQDIAFWVDVL